MVLSIMVIQWLLFFVLILRLYVWSSMSLPNNLICLLYISVIRFLVYRVISARESIKKTRGFGQFVIASVMYYFILAMLIEFLRLVPRRLLNDNFLRMNSISLVLYHVNINVVTGSVFVLLVSTRIGVTRVGMVGVVFVLFIINFERLAKLL